MMVYAASSLTEAMKDIKIIYEKEHPDTEMVLNLAGSKTLRVQIENGARPDLCLMANTAHYDALADEGLLSKRKDMLYNELVIVVPANNTVEIEGLKDLTKKQALVLGDVGVPVGDYSRQILKNYEEVAGQGYEEQVLTNIVSVESNVKQVLSKVVLGEADSAMVYRTDVTTQVQDQVKIVEIPQEYNVQAIYAVGTHLKADNTRRNQAFIEELQQDQYQSIFRNYGFKTIKAIEE